MGINSIKTSIFLRNFNRNEYAIEINPNLFIFFYFNNQTPSPTENLPPYHQFRNISESELIIAIVHA